MFPTEYILHSANLATLSELHCTAAKLSSLSENPKAIDITINHGEGHHFVYCTPVFYSAKGVRSIYERFHTIHRFCLHIPRYNSHSWVDTLLANINIHLLDQLNTDYKDYTFKANIHEGDHLLSVDLDSFVFDSNLKTPLLQIKSAIDKPSALPGSGYYKARVRIEGVSINSSDCTLEVVLRATQLIYQPAYISAAPSELTLTVEDFPAPLSGDTFIFRPEILIPPLEAYLNPPATIVEDLPPPPPPTTPSSRKHSVKPPQSKKKKNSHTQSAPEEKKLENNNNDNDLDLDAIIASIYPSLSSFS